MAHFDQPAPSGGSSSADHSSAPDPTSTMELLSRARKGDRPALESLLRRYLTPLQRWSRGRLPVWARDLLDTNDLVQETLLRTVRGLDGFDPRHSGAFQGYMRRCLDNKLRDELRRVARRPAADDTLHEIEDARPSPLEQTIGQDTLDRYQRALDTLGPETREAVIARIELGFSYPEIATSLGKPSADAARMAVKRGLVRLAKHMADTSPPPP